jgi:SAM-dependent methyltransferase
MSDPVVAARTAFSAVADEYDRGRPGYPDAVFDALGPLSGLDVADVGAGTGIATRALVRRGARAVAVDPSRPMLARAVDRSEGLVALVADGAHLPLRDGSVDLVTFAQSWHWLDPELRDDEVHRVLRPGGRWAGWWNHARGAPWLDRYWDLVERATPGVLRTQRDIDWGAGLHASGRFAVRDRISVAWERTMSIDHQLTDNASHSHIAALAPPDRERLLADLRRVYEDAFPDGTMTIPIETWLWIGDRVDGP